MGLWLSGGEQELEFGIGEVGGSRWVGIRRHGLMAFELLRLGSICVEFGTWKILIGLGVFELVRLETEDH